MTPIQVQRDAIIKLDPTAEYRFPFGNAFVKDGYLYLRNGNFLVFTCVRYFSFNGMQYVKASRYIRSKTVKWKNGEYRTMFRAWLLPLPDGVYEIEIPATHYYKKRWGYNYSLFYLEFIDGDMIWTTRQKFISVSKHLINHP